MENIKELMDENATGLKIYSWEWNQEARRQGAHKVPPVGLIAQHVQEKYPEAVSELRGYLVINYDKLHDLVGI